MLSPDARARGAGRGPGRVKGSWAWAYLIVQHLRAMRRDPSRLARCRLDLCRLAKRRRRELRSELSAQLQDTAEQTRAKKQIVGQTCPMPSETLLPLRMN